MGCVWNLLLLQLPTMHQTPNSSSDNLCLECGLIRGFYQVLLPIWLWVYPFGAPQRESVSDIFHCFCFFIYAYRPGGSGLENRPSLMFWLNLLLGKHHEGALGFVVFPTTPALPPAVCNLSLACIPALFSEVGCFLTLLFLLPRVPRVAPSAPMWQILLLFTVCINAFMP